MKLVLEYGVWNVMVEGEVIFTSPSMVSALKFINSIKEGWLM